MAGFEFLEDTNKWLEGVPKSMNESFESYIGNGKKVTQNKVDQICTWLAWKVNISIERERQRVLRALYHMYKTTAGGKVMQMASAIKSFVSDPIGSIGKFAGAIASPITSVFQWVSTLVTEVPRLGKNLANIAASLPPSPPTPHINYDKFKLKIGTISLDAIVQDPSSLPPPEVMFPEPEKPWTKNDFDEEMNPKDPPQKEIFYEVPEESEIIKAARQSIEEATDSSDNS